MTRSFKTATLAALTVALAGAASLATTTEAEARWRHRGWHGGAIAAGVVGGLALGALAASAAPRYAAPVVADPGYGGCYRVRRAVWSDYHGAYVSRRVTVCE